MHAILSKFPKIRKELPKEFKEIYKTHYQINRQGKTKVTSLSMRMEKWLHKRVAADVQKVGCDTLEIGAGTLNQLSYEPKVKLYDIVEPFAELYQGSPNLLRINHVYNDILEIDLSKKYERITSIASFEHILDLPSVVAKSSLLLTSTGKLRVSIPNEGTLWWKLGTLITGYEFKKMYGLNYQILLNYEHVNTANEIEEVLKYFFKKMTIKYFGLNRRMAFYVFFECKNPDIAKALNYLKQRKILH